MKHTPGPWVWTSGSAGPEDEYGCKTMGEIDVINFKSEGFIDNPVLYGNSEEPVIQAGYGEYNPYSNPYDALLIAAAPDLLAALQGAMFFIPLGTKARDAANSAIDRATGVTQ